MGLAEPDRVRAVLEAGGFRGVALEDLAVPFRFGGDLDAAVAMARDIGMMRSLLADLDADAVARAVDALRTAMAAHETRDGVELDSAWIATARQIVPMARAAILCVCPAAHARKETVVSYRSTASDEGAPCSAPARRVVGKALEVTAAYCARTPTGRHARIRSTRDYRGRWD
jgi:hypothetical protein